jgi:hypothetical protein
VGGLVGTLRNCSSLNLFLLPESCEGLWIRTCSGDRILGWRSLGHGG